MEIFATYIITYACMLILSPKQIAAAAKIVLMFEIVYTKAVMKSMLVYKW